MMTPKERIELEIKSHNKAIEGYKRDIGFYKQDIQGLFEKLTNEDCGGYKNATSLWGLVCSMSESAWKKQKEIETLQDLIELKRSLL
jgi:hypothetical protein